MVRQVGQFCRLDAEILERLRPRVDHLVQKLLLDLICGNRDAEPEFVEVVGEELVNWFGQIDVATLLEDLAVDEFRDLGHGILCGTVEFEGLARRGVVEGDLFQGLADIDCLREGYSAGEMVQAEKRALREPG